MISGHRTATKYINITLRVIFQSWRHIGNQRWTDSNAHDLKRKSDMESVRYIQSLLRVGHHILPSGLPDLQHQGQHVGVHPDRDWTSLRTWHASRAELLHQEWRVDSIVGRHHYHSGTITRGPDLLFSNLPNKSTATSGVPYSEHSVSGCINGDLNPHGIQTATRFWWENRIHPDCFAGIRRVPDADIRQYS